MNNNTPALLVNRDEAARLLCCCARTVDALLKSGDLKAIKLGRAVRIARSDLELFVQRQQQQEEANN